MNDNQKIRYFILGFFLLLFSALSLKHFIYQSASVDALCPFGGFESVYTYFTTGNFVPRVLMSSMILAVSVLVVTLLFRKGFCGWICPFGAIQEFVGAVRDKFKGKELKIKFDSYLIYLKYIILAVILIGSAYTGSLIFRGFDPFMSFFHFGKGIIWDYSADEFLSHIAGFVLAIIILVGSYFITRVWCRYLCPLGAGLSFFSFGPVKIKRNEKCIDCKKCDRVCQAGIKVSKQDTMGVECISCSNCIEVCPKKALNYEVFGKKISPLVYASLVIGVFFLIIFGSMYFGIWNSIVNVDEIDSSSFSGDQINGWMTLADVSKASGISVEKLKNRCGLSDDVDENLALNQIGNTYGFDFHTQVVRDYIDGKTKKYDINGDMTIMDVMELTEMCIGHMSSVFGFPSGIDLNTKLKDVSEKYNIDFSVSEMSDFLEDFEHDEGEEEHADYGGHAAETKDVLCPWGIRNDPYPGRCGIYVDKDGNSICDYSE